MESIRIPLTQGKYAIIDADDYDLVSQRKWHIQPGGSTFYATAGQYVDGRLTTLRMHRLILDAPSDAFVDHRDGDGLNNRRSNLRLCTPRQNHQNQCTPKHNTSGFRGVTYDKKNEKWKAQIRHFNKLTYLGLYLTAEDAAHAYDMKAHELFGEFARLNLPDGDGNPVPPSPGSQSGTYRRRPR